MCVQLLKTKEIIWGFPSKKAKGSSYDLAKFYNTIITAIREVDPHTPIMVDAGWYAAADSFSYWDHPLKDDKVLYSFHMYEPYAATSAPHLKRKTPYRYPGLVPFSGDKKDMWDSSRVDTYLNMTVEWARSRGIPVNRLVAGEFGCVRKMNDCAAYLNDVITAFDRNALHWAFYSFREDAWDAMNYELGVKDNVGFAYWEAVKNNKPDPSKYKTSPLFSLIQKKL